MSRPASCGERRSMLEASRQTGLPLATFPPACPWAVAQLLDVDFWPQEEGSPAPC
jgi:hypothetical protein